MALDIGRHVFSYLNKIELLLASYSLHILYLLPTLPTTSTSTSRLSLTTTALLAPLILTLESTFLLPTLLVSARDKVERGVFLTNDKSHRRAHFLYALAEVLKFASLVATVAKIGNLFAAVMPPITIDTAAAAKAVEHVATRYVGPGFPQASNATGMVQNAVKYGGERLVGWMDTWKKA
ncbi:hypothetical protein HDU93_002816 [Gonapodya sp. JEL0774]|nr:hypothetical protein HDU93_002816 [Gonapodya sp. JEL0774]